MGMTIDESNRILVDRYIDTYVVCGGENYNPAINITRQDYEAFQVAIHTMRKYQKIKGIVRFGNANELGFEYVGEKITEVIEDDT